MECQRQLQWLRTQPQGFEENIHAQVDAGTSYEDVAGNWRKMGWPGPMSEGLEQWFTAAMRIENLGHAHYVHLKVLDVQVGAFDLTATNIARWVVELKNRALAEASRR